VLTEKQKKARKLGLGGSDCAAVLGLSPFTTPMQLYYEKLNNETDDKSSEAMYWGAILEDIIAKEYAKRTGYDVRRVNRAIHSKDNPFMFANLDRKLVGQNKILECKTTHTFNASAWGESGSDGIPEYYLTQLHHYMIVTGFREADLAVLIGGNDFRIYTIKANEWLLKFIAAKEASFWHDNVLKQVPPMPIGLSDINLLYARDNGQEIEATPQIEDLAKLLKKVKIAEGQAKEKKADIELTIKRYMQDATVLVDMDETPLITWRSAKDSKRLNTAMLKEHYPDVYEACNITQHGSRRFLVK